jgi:hypothetical protein
VIISSSYSSRGNRLDPGVRFSSLGDETSICTAIAATIFVHSIPSRNRSIGMSLFERKDQLILLFGSYSRKSKKIGCVIVVRKLFEKIEKIGCGWNKGILCKGVAGITKIYRFSKISELLRSRG